MSKAALHNLGCKVNAYETEAMQQQLEEYGYEIVPFGQETDVYVINTRSVTNITDRKSRQMLHHAKKLNPEAVVAAADCYAQVASDILKEDDSADVIIGSNDKARLAGILGECMKDRQGGEGDYVLDTARARGCEELHVSRLGEYTRTFIKVQGGYNQSYSYYIIPYVRGRVGNRRPEGVEAEVRGPVTQGYREVVLTGIHSSSYGTKHMKEDPVKGGDWDGGPLWDLIERIHQVGGLECIHLDPLEPRIIIRESAERLTGLPEFRPHLHLSLQSGCNVTLKHINRYCIIEDYLRCCGIFREIFDCPTITTDVVAGFPGETKEKFEEIRRFLEIARLHEIHIFKYFKRQDTRAAVMEDQVSEQVKTRRSGVLLELGKTMSREYRERFTGNRVSILFERAAEVEGKQYMMGYTSQYIGTALSLENEMNREEFGGRIVELFTSELPDDEMLEMGLS